jgi:hypothetical protein
MTFKPWHFIIVALAGWLNRQQQDVIAYLKTENRILRQELGTKRVRLNEQQKCRLNAVPLRQDGLTGLVTAARSEQC